VNTPTHRDWFGLDVFRPGPDFCRPQGECYLLDSVGSTSDFLLGRGEPASGRRCLWREWGWEAQPVARHTPPLLPAPGTLAVARRQTHGRGRQGRHWQDCGGLFLSWVWRFDLQVLRAGLPVWMGLITALALGEQYGLNIQLKWPNDLLVGGRKLGGFLIDRIGTVPAGTVVVGLGLNLGATKVDLPPSLLTRATSLQMLLGSSPQPAEVAGVVLARLGAERARFEGEGWQPFSRSFMRLDWLAGRAVTLTTGKRIVQGYAGGIDRQGALIVITPGGPTGHLRAGDVHLTEPEPGDPRVTALVSAPPAGTGRRGFDFSGSDAPEDHLTTSRRKPEGG